MAKVSIVKWSQKWIFVARTPFFSLTPDLKIALKTAIFKYFWYARNDTSGNKNLNLRPLYDRYFCHITIIKWSQICTRIIRKYFSEDIFLGGSFPIEITIGWAKNSLTQFLVVLWWKIKMFWNQGSKSNNKTAGGTLKFTNFLARSPVSG